ncbi:ATP-binding protein [Streptomyces sp. NPDC046909]|uniref:ATP-binding protein n=1 Tax=Streptomyces sp. NPDC046909 TaxID=3155617 RepID=UPI0033C13CA6
MATVTPPWAYTLHLPHDPLAPGIARATLRTVLAAHGLAEVAPVAELLASELLTNDPRVPPGFGGADIDVPPPDAENGRGLHLVRAFADSVGVSVLRELGASKGGKLLWAECR